MIHISNAGRGFSNFWVCFGSVSGFRNHVVQRMGHAGAWPQPRYHFVLDPGKLSSESVAAVMEKNPTSSKTTTHNTMLPTYDLPSVIYDLPFVPYDLPKTCDV
eukprot:938419-Amphidinium_carterae.1